MIPNTRTIYTMFYFFLPETIKMVEIYINRYDKPLTQQYFSCDRTSFESTQRKLTFVRISLLYLLWEQP